MAEDEHPVTLVRGGREQVMEFEAAVQAVARERADGTLLSCIAKAQAEIGSMPFDKIARIQSQKANYSYEYLSEGALMAKVREILSPLGVAILTNVESTTHTPGRCVTRISITFAKGTERETIYGEGVGDDPQDKAYNKSITSAVRITLTKQFLQGGDIDPEQTANDRPAAGPAKLDERTIKRLTQKAIDCKITTPDGALDPKKLLRIASYAVGAKVTRIDEIPPLGVVKLVDGVDNKTPMLDGYVANPAAAEAQIVAMEVERGW